MRFGIPFHAQNDDDARTAVFVLSQASSVQGLAHVKQDDTWFLTTEVHFTSFDEAMAPLDPVRAPFKIHTGHEGCDYVQTEEGERFIPCRDFTLVVCQQFQQTKQMIECHADGGEGR